MPDMLKKTFAAEIEKADDGFVAVISTGKKDRDGDIMVAEGVELKNYRRNNVIMWAHDHSVPAIGTAKWVKVEGNKIKAKPRFASTPFAQEIATLYEEDVLKSFSVGFIPIDWEDLKDGGRRYNKWELIEFSAVNVPANADALVMKAKSLSDEVRRALDIELPDEVAELRKELKEATDRIAELELLEQKRLETAGKEKAADMDAALQRLEKEAVQAVDVADAFDKGAKNLKG